MGRQAKIFKLLALESLTTTTSKFLFHNRLYADCVRMPEDVNDIYFVITVREMCVVKRAIESRYYLCTLIKKPVT